jgi:hypothetical protein
MKELRAYILSKERFVKNSKNELIVTFDFVKND